MSQNGQTHFKNLAAFAACFSKWVKFFKVCLTILRYYAWVEGFLSFEKHG